MRPLQKQPGIAPLPKGHDAGSMAEFAVLPISALRVDDKFQRDLGRSSESNIAKIAARFSWAKFRALMVVRDGEFYSIIDGQHRAIAALSLGFERVPCLVVKVSPAAAADIFTAINGDTTPLSILALFKAARAAGTEWARLIDDICAANGVTPCVYPIPANKMKPGMTLAVGTLRRILERHGPRQLSLLVRCLVATKGAAVPGFLSHPILRNWNVAFNLHPFWLDHEEAVVEVFSRFNLAASSEDEVARAVNDRLGAKAKAAAIPDFDARVKELAARGFSKSQIAARLRMPYAEIERVLA